MADMEALFKQVDALTAEEVKELYTYIMERHVKFVAQPPNELPKERVLGLHAHLGPHWMSDDFNDELPIEFWLGEDDLSS